MPKIRMTNWANTKADVSTISGWPIICPPANTDIMKNVYMASSGTSPTTMANPISTGSQRFFFSLVNLYFRAEMP